MKKGRGWLTVAVVGPLALASLYFWRSDAATIDEPRRIARVGRSTMARTVIATGVIRPVVGAEINVGSRISGTVVHLPVKVGDRVEAGQLLAELDRAALDAAFDQARAELALARPRVALAVSKLERRRSLAESGVATGEDLDVAVRDLAVERARLRAAEARLRSAEIVLGYTRITAPIPGVVAEVTTREGETVAADFSAPTFVTLVDLDRLEVLAYVDETDVGRVFVGQSASFSVDTYPGAEFSATVTAKDRDEDVHVPTTTVMRRLRNVDYIGGAKLIVRDPETVEQTAGQIAEILRRRHLVAAGEPDDFAIYTPKFVGRMIARANRVLKVFLPAAAGVALLVAAMVISSIMLIAVRERVAEVGLRKAVGATEGQISFQFLAEAVGVTLASGLLGLALGAAVVTAVAGRMQLPAAITADSIVLGLVAAIAVGIVSGFLPARRAARLDPIEALR